MFKTSVINRMVVTVSVVVYVQGPGFACEIGQS